MPGFPIEDFLRAAGLLLDIIGVIVLAIPEFPKMARQFRFGRLRAALYALDRGGLTEGDAGFREIVSLYNESKPNVEITPSDVVKIEYGPRIRPILQEGDPAGYRVANLLIVEYTDESKFAGLNIQELETAPEHIYPEIRQSVEGGERNVRFVGLICIAIGFGLQLATFWIG